MSCCNVNDRYLNTLDDIVWDTDADYKAAILEIYRSLKYNDDPYWYLKPFANTTIWTAELVDKVIHAYIDIINTTDLPEFSDDWDFVKNNKEKVIELLNIVAVKSKYDYETVKRVLRQLYWHTVKKVIPSTRFLKPRTTNTSYDSLTGNNPLSSTVNGVKNTVGAVFNAAGNIVQMTAKTAEGASRGVLSISEYLPVILLVGGGIAAVYYASSAYKNFKGLKNIFNTSNKNSKG